MTGEGRVGIVQGYKSYFLLDDDGQVQPTHSLSAGLDYPGIGPELARLGETGRVEFLTATDREAIEAVRFFAREEGVVFALESAHAGAAAMRLLPDLEAGQAMIVNMSGRGDKDLFICAPEIQPEEWGRYLRDEAEIIARTKPVLGSTGGSHGRC
jgi:tryptophan synthase beta chain